MNKKNPIKYIEEIIEYIDDIQGFIKGITYSEFEDSKQTQYSVLYALLIIREAAKKFLKIFVLTIQKFPGGKSQVCEMF